MVLKSIIYSLIILLVSIACIYFFYPVSDEGSPAINEIIPKETEKNETDSGGAEADATKEKGDEQVGEKPVVSENGRPGIVWSMKLVNEDVNIEDLDLMEEMGFEILSGEWGMDDTDTDSVLKLLDEVEARSMKFVINFSDGSAWGYREDGTDPPDKKPVWQKNKVQNYIKALNNHPAIYGYDVSNEAGENLPNGDTFRITTEQMRQARNDVLETDDEKPIIIRMHYWDDEDGDFGWKNPFSSGIADIVMLNLYSNYTDDGQSLTVPGMVKESGQVLVDKIKAIDSDIRIWIALAAFMEDSNFLKTSAADLKRDISAAKNIKSVENIGFFGWGPERYPEEGSGWYLPRDGKNHIEIMGEAISQS